MSINNAIERLHSLPQVLVKILSAIHDERASARSVANVVRNDPAIATRLIALANTGTFSNSNDYSSIDTAISRLGLSAVKTVVVTTARRQLLESFNDRHTQLLKTHWQRSVFTARIAVELASLTNYTSSDEAYLGGLLADIGQLACLVRHDDDRPSQLVANSQSPIQRIADHESCPKETCAVGAELFDDWQIHPFVINAILYHRERAEEIQGAHHLVKLIKLAGLFAQQHGTADQRDTQELLESQQLLELDEDIIRDLVDRIRADVEQLAFEYGVGVGKENDGDRQARKNLGEQMAMLANIDTISCRIFDLQHSTGIQNALQNSLLLTCCIQTPLVFLYREDRQSLEVWLSGDNARVADFSIPTQPNVSVVSDCHLRNSLTSAILSESTTIVDRQLIEHIGTKNLFCVSLVSDYQSIGVLAFGHAGLAQGEFERRPEFAQHLAAMLAKHLDARRTASGSSKEREVNEEGVDLRVLEAVHEVSNPLTIILNHLEILRVSVSEEHKDDDRIKHIKGEIEEVRKIMARLSSPTQYDNSEETLHHVIESLTETFRMSLSNKKRINIFLNLSDDTKLVVVDSVLFRQVLTNLLKNAAEALQEKGKILILTESNISVSGKSYFAIYVHDNGPGIPKKLRQALFSPIKSTKGGGHSGLGLSIVKKLLDEIGGTIVCRSNADSRARATGTQFQILIPTSSQEGQFHD